MNKDGVLGATMILGSEKERRAGESLKKVVRLEGKKGTCMVLPQKATGSYYVISKKSKCKS